MSFAFRMRGQPLRRYQCFDFSGGLYRNSDATYSGAPGRLKRFLSDTLNTEFNADGSIQNRRPFDLVSRATTLGVNNTDISGGCQFIKSDGTSQVIVAATDGNLYNVSTTDPTSVTSIKSGLTSTKRTHFATYNDTLFICNGVDAPMQYDGTTVTALGGSSPATMRYVVAHGNRLFASATAAPGRLYWSKLNNPTDWSGTTDAGFIDIDPNDGSNIQSLVSSNQELVIIKNRRPYRLQGIGPTTGYTVVDNLVPANGSIGTKWPGAATYAMNDVWYASFEGVHRLSATDKFGDVAEGFVSANIDPLFRDLDGTAYSIDMNSTLWASTLNFDADAQVVYNPGDDCLYIPAVSGLLLNSGAHSGDHFWGGYNQLLVYNIPRKAWSIWQLGDITVGNDTGPIEIQSIWPYKQKHGRWTIMAACVATDDGNGSYIVKLMSRGDNDFTTSGLLVEDTPKDAKTSASLVASYQTIIEHTTDLGAPGPLKSPRQIIIHGTGSVGVKVWYDANSNGTADVDTTATYSSSLGIMRVNLPPGVCNYMTIRLTTVAGNKFTLSGIEVLWRPRHEMKPET